MGVSVIVVNYNVTEEVENCINSIYEKVLNTQVEIIVIDNNSADRGIEQLKNKFPEVRFEFLKENLGYAKANNYGVQLSKYENILLLNPDTILIEDFISPLDEFVNENPKAGACGPMLLYKDLTFQFSNGYRLGLIYETAEAFMIINLYRKMLKWVNKKKYLANRPFIVNWMSGACLFMRKEVFNRAEGFNTTFFLNYEDIELCKRINDFGYINYYFPYLKCIHLDQASQKKNWESFTHSRYVSRLIYAENHYNKLTRFTVKIIHILGLFLRLLIVNFVYLEDEKLQRTRGYKKSLKLYFNSSYADERRKS